MGNREYLEQEESHLSDKLSNLRMESSCQRHPDPKLQLEIRNVESLLEAVRNSISGSVSVSEDEGLSEKEEAYAYCLSRYCSARGYCRTKGMVEFQKYYLNEFEKRWNTTESGSEEFLSKKESVWKAIEKML